MIVSGHLIHLHCFFPVLAVYQSRPQSSSAHDGTRVEQNDGVWHHGIILIPNA